MIKYCFRCGKESKTKCNLNKHLRNKKECYPIYLDIPREYIINHYNMYEQDFLIKKESISLKSKEINLGSNKIIKEINNKSEINNDIIELSDDIVCEFCGKKYSHKTNYYRHKKYYCNKKKETDEKNKLMDEFLNTKYNLLKIEYEEKMEEKMEEKFEEERIKNSVLKEKLEKKIKKLESQLAPYSLQNNTNNINNGHIGDNNITIINNFGEEKFNMTAQDCEKIMSHEFDMIVKLIEYIHIIPPENRNAFIPSLKEKYAMILRDQKWDLVDRKDFIDNLVINKNIMLEKMLEEYGSKFVNVSAKRSENVKSWIKNLRRIFFTKKFLHKIFTLSKNPGFYFHKNI